MTNTNKTLTNNMTEEPDFEKEDNLPDGKQFKFAAKSVFLTYAQSKLSPEQIAEYLGTIGCHRYVIGTERHRDGGTHFHVVAGWEKRIQTKNPRYFDIANEHPNIQCPRNIRNCLAYATKDDPKPLCVGFKLAKKGWGDIFKEASTPEEYLQGVLENYPRDAALAWERLSVFATTHFAKRTRYAPPADKFTLPEPIQYWLDSNFSHVKQLNKTIS